MNKDTNKKIIIFCCSAALILISGVCAFKFNGQSSKEFKDISTTIVNGYYKYWATYDTNTDIIYLSGNNSSLSPLYFSNKNGQIEIETKSKYKEGREFEVIDSNIKYTIGAKSENVYVTYDSMTGIVYFEMKYGLVPIFNKDGLPMMKEEFDTSKTHIDRFKVASSIGEYKNDLGTTYYDTSTNIVYVFSGDSICAIFNKNGKAMNLDEFSKDNKKNRFKKLDIKYNELSVYCDDVSNVLYLKGKNYIVPLYKTSTEVMTNKDVS